MKLSEIVTAAPALQKLIMQDVPIRLAYALAQLINKCNPQLDFYGREIVKIGNEENDRRQELLNLELEEFDKHDPIVIPLGINISLSAADIKCLEPLVIFKDQER